MVRHTKKSNENDAPSLEKCVIMTYLLSNYFDIIHSDFKLVIMKKLSNFIHSGLLIATMSMSGCGYMSDKAVDNVDVYKSEELQTCQIDVSKLSKIFKENQVEQIRCIESNLIMFTKYVKSQNQDAITEPELGLFVKKFFKSNSDAIIDGLNLIFQLDMILLKDDAGKISNQNITPLFDLLVKVNTEAVTISNILSELDDKTKKFDKKVDFWKKRKEFYEATTRLAQAVKGVIALNQKDPQKLNIKKFLHDMTTKLGGMHINTDLIESFLFLKKTVIGGDEQILTTDELDKLLIKTPEIAGLVFDIWYTKKEHFGNDQRFVKFYLNSIRRLNGVIKFDQPNFELMSSEEVTSLAKKLMKDTEIDIDAFKPSIEILKQKFIGGSKTSITLDDLAAVIAMGNDVLEKVYFTYLTYDYPANAKILNDSKVLIKDKDIPLRNLTEYSVFGSQARINQLYLNFMDTAKKYRYYRGEKQFSSYYHKDIVRTRSGFVEIDIEKWLSWKLLTGYGHTDAKKNLQITMDEFSQFLLDSKPILAELGLWSSNFQTFSRNVVLLADLFQEQSNGDVKMNLEETTEYLGMLLTAVDLSSKITKELKEATFQVKEGTATTTKSCNVSTDPKAPAFNTDCFNEKYFDIFLNKLDYKKSLPMLQKYVDKSSKNELLGYLKGVSGFARDDDSKDVPISTRDITLISGALLNIETTFIRFDKDQDNIIDYYELSEAFLVYKESIIEIAKLQDKPEYAKPVFLYMVSKMEVPDIGSIAKKGKFYAWSKCVQNSTCRNKTMDPVYAKRLNIGQLLYYMVKGAE